MFARPELLHLLWFIPLMLLVGLWSRWSYKKGLTAFADLRLIRRMTHGQFRFPSGRALVLRTLGCSLLIVALADPRWGSDLQRLPESDGQIIFLVDVSRSMLAEDARPSRLERAKSYVYDILEETTSYRAGLAAFAGNAERVVPLTTDLERFAQALEDLSPTSVSRGGSDLRSALSLAEESFVERLPGAKRLVLLTDGEHHGEDILEAAERLRQAEIELLIVGIGNREKGAPIPVVDASGRRAFLRFGGEVVQSKMNVALLSQLADAAGGQFVDAGTGGFDVERIWRSSFAPQDAESAAFTSVEAKTRRYPWFLAAAFVALVLEPSWAFVNTLRSIRRRFWFALPSRLISRQSTAAAACLIVIVAAGAMQSERELIRAGNAALREGRVEEALSAYRRAQVVSPGSKRALLNEGLALYRSGEFQSARERFAQSLKTSHGGLEAQVHFNLGNCDVAEVRAGGLSKEEALQRLDHAILCYRNALLLNPGWSKPRENIEFARMLMKQLERQQSRNGNGEGSSDPSRESSDPQDSETEERSDENKTDGDSGTGPTATSTGDESDESAGQDAQPPSEADEGQPRKDQLEPPGSDAPEPDARDEETQESPRSSGRPESNESYGERPSGGRRQDGAPDSGESRGAGGSGLTSAAPGEGEPSRSSGGSGLIWDMNDMKQRPISETEAENMILRILEQERERVRTIQASPPEPDVERDW